MEAAYGAFHQNLSYFDNDGPDGIPASGDDDGYVDAVVCIHPGQGAEVAPISQEPFLLWSHEAGISVYQDCRSPAARTVSRDAARERARVPLHDVRRVQLRPGRRRERDLLPRVRPHAGTRGSLRAERLRQPGGNGSASTR